MRRTPLLDVESDLGPPESPAMFAATDESPGNKVFSMNCAAFLIMAGVRHSPRAGARSR